MTRRLAGILVFLCLGCGSDGSSDPAPDPVNPAPVEPGPDPVPDPDPAPDLEPGWHQQETGTQLDFTAVSAVDSNHAWAAAGSSIFRTTDGGATWTFISQTPLIIGLDFRPPVGHLRFHDLSNGWALTTYQLLRTSDGGETWEIRSATLVSPWAGMSTVNAASAWKTSLYYGGVSWTHDGGATWESTNTGGGGGKAVEFVDVDTGWLALRRDGSEIVLKSTDGGTTWQECLSIAGDYDAFYTRDIATAGPDHVWILAGTTSAGLVGGRIMASADGGATWQEQQSDGSGGFWDVHFADTDNGWIAGRKIHRTTNGGATWTVQATPTEGFRDVDFVSSTVGWAVGEDGVILKTTSGGD